MDTSTPIVFSYIGNAIPDFLIENIRRMSELFSTNDIYLICSSSYPHLESIPRLTVLTNRDYLNSREVQYSLNNLTHETVFRNGFWRYTIERLFSIHNLLSISGMTDFLYVESDVILMQDFPFAEVRSKAKKHPIIWSEHSDDNDSAALIYMSGHEHITWFIQQLINELSINPSHTDMSALKSIRRKFPQMVGIFPSNISSARSFEWSGVFDSAAIGMWLTGQDPRNNYGVTLVRDSNHLKSRGERFEVEGIRGIEYILSNTLRVNYGDISVPIYCLHIHSKNKRLFKSDSEYLQKLCKDSKKHFAIESFSLSMLTKLFFQNFRQRTLLSYFRHMCKCYVAVYRSYRNRNI